MLEKSWKITYKGKTYGPMDSFGLSKHFRGKTIPEDIEISEYPEGKWLKISEDKEFSGIWYIKINDKQYGLYSTETLEDMVESKKINKYTSAARAIAPDNWADIAEYDEFKTLFFMDDETVKCAQCGAINKGDAEICSLCQIPLKKKTAAADSSR